MEAWTITTSDHIAPKSTTFSDNVFLVDEQEQKFINQWFNVISVGTAIIYISICLAGYIDAKFIRIMTFLKLYH